ncbi:MAG: trigger factor [Clostridia bacterium]|nr:MAG: trigger factor [Clostridia bacterium]
MQTQVEKIDGSRVRIQIEVEPTVLDQALERAYRKLVKQVAVPGFRRGKVPRRVLENYIGREPIYTEAVDMVVPEAYKEAVAQGNVEPVGQPELEIVKMEEGQPFVFTATVEVKPEVTLGQYKGLAVERPQIEVTEARVEEQLRLLQQRYARMEAVEEGFVAEGDLVTLDFHGTVDGQTFPGADAENYTLEVGKDRFMPGFAEQLVGARPGEEREIRVHLPQDYVNETLAGKEVIFRVTIKEVKRPVLSDLDDEFARDVSEFDTLEELKEDIRKRLYERAEAQAREKTRQQLAEMAAQNATLEIPPAMVQMQVEAAVRDLQARLQTQGLTLEDYLKLTDTSEEEMRQAFAVEAEQRLRRRLVLEAIAREENIQVIETEMEQEIAGLVKNDNRAPDAVRRELAEQGVLDILEENLKVSKALDFLVAQSQEKE